MVNRVSISAQIASSYLMQAMFAATRGIGGLYASGPNGPFWYYFYTLVRRIAPPVAMNMLSSMNTRTTGIILLALGAIVLALLDEGIPDRSRLTQVTGQLRLLEKATSKGGGLSAVRFSLSTDSRHLHYISKAGNIDDVWRALGHAGHSEVGVLIDPADSHVPPLDGRAFHTVFEVRVGDEMIRPYAHVVESLGTDILVGKALGYGSAVSGIALLFVHFLKRRRQRA